MKIGARVVPRPPFGQMRQVARRANDLGLAALWIPDHLMAFQSPAMFEGSGGPVPDEADLHAHVDPFVALTAIAESSDDLLLGTSVTDAVRRMPAALVQAALTLDHLAPGRIVLGLGAGETTNIVPFGGSMDRSGTHFRAAAREIRGFLDDPGPDERGGIIGLRPPTGSNGPQLWLAAHGPRGLHTTGQIADGWFPTLVLPPEWNAAREQVHQGARSAGRDPGAITLGLSLNVVIGDHHDDTHALLAHPAVRRLCLLMTPDQLREAGMPAHPLGGSGLHTIIATRDPDNRLAQAVRDFPLEVTHRLIPHGTVDEIAEFLQRYNGLEHVRLVDLGRRGDLFGELDRLHEVASRLEAG